MIGKKIENEIFMTYAISKATEGIEIGQTPFGACIVKDGKIISCEHNQVLMKIDITAHAEIMAIREACKVLGDADLSGCTIYTTCEPCPMCFSACHWARIDKIVYGAEIKDAKKAGFNEMEVSAKYMCNFTKKIKVVSCGGPLAKRCIKLFDIWNCISPITY